MDPLNSLITLHEANERLKEIHELKGNLPELLTQKKIELDDINKNEKTNFDLSIKAVKELFKAAVKIDKDLAN